MRIWNTIHDRQLHECRRCRRRRRWFANEFHKKHVSARRVVRAECAREERERIHKQTTNNCSFFTHLDPIIFLDDSPSYSSLLSVAVAADVGDDDDDGSGGSVVDDVSVARIDNGHKTVSAAAINRSVACIV